MSPTGLLQFLDYQQRHEELLKQAAEYRLIAQALKAQRPQKRGTSAILAMLGRELSSLGFSMEVRYGVQNESSTMLNQSSNPGGCS